MPDLIPQTLVPPGVSDRRNRDFVGALDAVLSMFSPSATLVQDALTAPAGLLPAMTIEAGFCEFVQPGMREDLLRRLLAAAPEIHAWTGTVRGARVALGSIGLTVRWVQWFQRAPKGAHDTHKVTVYINDHLFEGEDNLFSPRNLHAARRLIEATQRWSQSIDLDIGLGLDQQAGAACGSAGASGALVFADVRPVTHRSSAAGAAAGAAGISARIEFLEVANAWPV